MHVALSSLSLVISPLRASSIQQAEIEAGTEDETEASGAVSFPECLHVCSCQSEKQIGVASAEAA